MSNQLMPMEKMLFVVNSFRATVVFVLIYMSFLLDATGTPLIGGSGFYAWATTYVIVVVGAYLWPTEWLLNTVWVTVGSLIDIVMIVLLMYIVGGIRSGYGMLLLPFLAMSSLPVSGRHAMFYAAFASLSLLVGIGVGQWQGDPIESGEVFQTGLLALICFVVSGVTWYIARTARGAAMLASARGNEIANLNRLNSLALQGLREAVLVLSDDGRVAQFNTQAKRYFPNLQHGQILSSVQPLLDLWRKQPKMPLMVDHQVGNFRLSGRLVPVVDDGDAVLVLFLRDTVDIAEGALRVKLAALGRLTANIAHEIRNPLSAINHAADLLAEQASDPTDQRLARMICDNAKRIDRLVEEVLALNRRDRIRPEVFNLKDWITEFMNEFRLAHPDMPADGVILRHKGAPAIRFDRGHLHQIMWNLTANAWRHSSKQSRSVILELMPRGEHLLCLNVRDDGPGVPEAQQTNLFEPFFTTVSAGTGLGLYIARELAEANGARLEYIPPGGCFRITCRAISN